MEKRIVKLKSVGTLLTPELSKHEIEVFEIRELDGANSRLMYSKLSYLETEILDESPDITETLFEVPKRLEHLIERNNHGSYIGTIEMTYDNNIMWYTFEDMQMEQN